MNKLILALSLLLSAPALAVVTPGLVQCGAHYGTVSNDLGVTTYVLQMPNPTLAGNLLVVGMTFNHQPAGITSVTDDQSQTWSVGRAVWTDANATDQAIYYKANTAANVHSVTITTSGTPPQYFSPLACEFYNVAASSPLETAPTGTQGSSTTVTGPLTGALTSGDLVLQYVGFDGGQIPLTSVTAGSQSNITWALPDAGVDIATGDAFQWGVYTSTTSFAPTMTVSPTGHYMTSVVTFKAAASSQGSPPPSSGIYITGISHQNFNGVGQGFLPESASPKKFQMPCSGNLIVVATEFGDGTAVTGVSGTVSGTYSQAGAACTQNYGTNMAIWYKGNATVGQGDIISVTTNNNNHDGTMMAYCVTRAATSPLDSAAGQPCAHGNQTVAGNITPGSPWPLTPSGPGLFIGELGVRFNRVRTVTNSGFVFDADHMTLEDDATPINDFIDFDNGWTHYYNSNTNTIVPTWTFKVGGTATGEWDAFGAEFLAPAATTTRKRVIVVQ